MKILIIYPNMNLQENIRRILREETDNNVFGYDYDELLDNIKSS